MAKLSFLQAIIFTVFLVIAMQGFILGYLWRDGILPPEETGAQLTKLLAVWGPFAFILDVIIITPLLWWLGGKFIPRKTPKAVPPIVPPMINLPNFMPPPYDPTPQDSEQQWEELSWIR